MKISAARMAVMSIVSLAALRAPRAVRRVLTFLPLGLIAGLLAVSGAAAPRWIKAESGHFTLLSQGSDVETKKWAAELAQFQRGLQSILPVAPERLRPVTVVLFKTDRDFRPFKPREKGKPQNIAGLFSKTQDCQVIAFSLDYDADELRRVAYHEAVHWHISAAEEILPPWLEEGLAEVYSTFKAGDDGTYTFGGIMQSHLRFLMEAKKMPLRTLTSISRDSLSYNDGNRATLFYAQSWAFVHYLLFGEGTPGMQSVARYVAASATAPTIEVAFAEAFGDDHASLDQKLASYLRGGRYQTYTYRKREALPVQQRTVSAVRQGEVELALGTLLLSIADRRDEAVSYLHRAAGAMPERPDAWQALGEAALLANNYTEAFEHFTRAAERGSTSYFVHFGLGVSRMQGDFGGRAISNSGEANYAARDFRRAIELNPHFAAAYENLGGVLPAVDKPESEDRVRLERGWRISSKPGPIEIGLAACDLKLGERARARARLERLNADGTIPPEIRALAGTLLKDDDWARFGVRMQEYFEKRKYDDIIAAIDASRSEFTEPRYAPTLVINRDLAVHYRLLSEAVTLLNRGELAAVRPTLVRLSEHKDSNIRAEAKRLLEAMTKQVQRR